MKLRPMTRSRWVELLFGSVPGIFLMPHMILAMIVPIMILGTRFGASSLFLRFQEILVALGIGLAGLAGFMAWVSLTLLILLGPEQLARKLGPRRIFISIGVAGLLVSGFLIVRAASDWQLLLMRDLPFVLLLISCSSVGLRYMVLLKELR